MRVSSAWIIYMWIAGTIVGILAAEETGILKKSIYGSWAVAAVIHWLVGRFKSDSHH
jgi:hypothetical protein